VYDQNAHSTRVHMFSLDVQRELKSGFVVAAGYSGSVTHNLIQGTPAININQLPDADLALGSKLNSKVANPFYGNQRRRAESGVFDGDAGATPASYPQFGAISLTGSDQNHARSTRSTSSAKALSGRGSDRNR